MDVIDAGTITPAWLTRTLRATNVLTTGVVTNIQVTTSRQLFVSIVSQLKIEYSVEAESTAPRNLFLKTPIAPAADQPDAHAEIVFYRTVAPAMADAPVPRCFDAACSGDGRWHLLLEDLTESHGGPSFPPAMEESSAAIDVLAQVTRFGGNIRD